MEEKKKGKGLTIFLVFIILLLIGGLGYEYYLYNDIQKDNKELKEDLKEVKKELKKAKKKAKENTEAQEEKTTKEYTYSLKNIKCQKKLGKCDKTVTVDIAGKSNKVTIVSLENEKYDIYINDVKVDSGLEGFEYDDFDGNIYIFNDKYIGVLRAVHLGDYGSSGYRLTLYNDGKRFGNDEIIKVQGQSICKEENCSTIINNLEDFEFDGKSLQYWNQSCESKSNVKYSLEFDGTKVTKSIVEKVPGLYGSGASGC